MTDIDIIILIIEIPAIAFMVLSLILTFCKRGIFANISFSIGLLLLFAFLLLHSQK